MGRAANGKRRSLHLAKALTDLRAVDLFLDLDDGRLAALERELAREGGDAESEVARSVDAELARVLELHATEPFPRRRRPSDAFVHAPASLRDLERVGVPIRVVVDPLDVELEHVTFPDGRTIIYRLGETFADVAAAMDAVLAELGDDRRCFPIAAADFEEPRYVLATPKQVRALTKARVRDVEVEAGTAHVVAVATYARAVARKLAATLGVDVATKQGEVVIELDERTAPAFVVRLREATRKRSS